MGILSADHATLSAKVGIVRSRTKATEFVLLFLVYFKTVSILIGEQ
jgi:hypothetical protein